MGKYVTNDAQMDVLYVASFETLLESVLEKWLKENEKGSMMHSKEKLKTLRMTKTYAHKTLMAMLNDVDREQLSIIQKNTAKYRTIVTYTKNAQAEWKKQCKMEDVIPVPVEHLIQFMEQAKASCCVCESEGQDVQECPTYRLFLKYSTEIVNPEPGNGCPFRPRQEKEGNGNE